MGRPVQNFDSRRGPGRKVKSMFLNVESSGVYRTQEGGRRIPTVSCTCKLKAVIYIKIRNVQWVGHVECMDLRGISSRLIKGKLEGKRPPGKHQNEWENQVDKASQKQLGFRKKHARQKKVEAKTSGGQGLTSECSAIEEHPFFKTRFVQFFKFTLLMQNMAYQFPRNAMLQIFKTKSAQQLDKISQYCSSRSVSSVGK